MTYGEFKLKLEDSGDKELVALANNGPDSFRGFLLYSAALIEAEKRGAKDASIFYAQK